VFEAKNNLPLAAFFGNQLLSFFVLLNWTEEMKENNVSIKR